MVVEVAQINCTPWRALGFMTMCILACHMVLVPMGFCLQLVDVSAEPVPEGHNLFVPHVMPLIPNWLCTDTPVDR